MKTKINKRYRTSNYMEEEPQEIRLNANDNPFPDYFEKELDNIEKQTEVIVQKLKKYAYSLDDLQIKIKKRERNGDLALPEIYQIYQSLSMAVRRLDDLNTLITNMENQLHNI